MEIGRRSSPAGAPAGGSSHGHQGRSAPLPPLPPAPTPFRRGVERPHGTALWRRRTPSLARVWLIEWRGCLARPLAQGLAALGQRGALSVGIEPPAAHTHRVGWRHRPEKAPDELIEGQTHRPRLRLAPGPLGPLFIPEDHALAIV